jgi:carbamoyltransferase
MLLVAKVREDKRIELSEADRQLTGTDLRKAVRSTVPAITHVDYSARVQSVNRDDNPLYYDMIDAFRRSTGCPVIINTSFNVRGEPIVCTPEHAFTCFMRTRMDYLLLGRYLLNKEEQPALEEDTDWRQEFELD